MDRLTDRLAERHPGGSVLAAVREIEAFVASEEGDLFQIRVGAWVWHELVREWQAEGLAEAPDVVRRYVRWDRDRRYERTITWEASIRGGYRYGQVEFVSPAELARRRRWAPFRDGAWIPEDEPEPRVTIRPTHGSC